MPQFPRETTTTLVLICLITLYKTLKIILFVSQGGGAVGFIENPKYISSALCLANSFTFDI